MIPSESNTIDVLRAPLISGARALFTTRHGGAGHGNFASANLGRHVGDDPEIVEANRALLARAIGAPLVFVDQVHGTDVLALAAVDPVPVSEIPVTAADAIVTDRSDIALAIMVADCLPVLMCDSDAGVVAAAHAGRRGLLDGVLAATVEQMVTLGARPDRVRAVVGPSVCGACYEVPEQMRAQSAVILSATSAVTSWGAPALDLRAGAIQALIACGLEHERINADAPCTLEDEAFFSYRRSPRTGRFAGVIRLDPVAG